MDTDNLTPMAYETLSLASKASDYLRSEIGAAVMQYSTEDQFLAGISGFLQEILQSPEEYLDMRGLLGSISVAKFLRHVKCTHAHIVSTLNVPLDQRGDPPFKKVRRMPVRTPSG